MNRGKKSFLSLRHSRDAIGFLALFLAIALAGFNSGNNLLYLISGIMLACILVSLAAGYINISLIDVNRYLPPHIFAGQSFRIRLEISNRKKRFNSFGLELAGAGGKEPVFVPFVAKKEKSTREVELRIDRRGIHKFEAAVISSRFPWGLFDLRKKGGVAQELIVYPPVYEMERVVTGSSRIRDEFPQFLKGSGSGLYGIREYRHGEDIANISWKLSAKLDELIVRETEAEEKRKVCVVLQNTIESASDENLQAFERTVSAAASLVWYLSRNGYLVKLVTRDKIVGYGSGREQMHKMLIMLALIQPIKDSDTGFVTDRRLWEGGTGILVRCAGGAAVQYANKFAFIVSGDQG